MTLSSYVSSVELPQSMSQIMNNTNSSVPNTNYGTSREILAGVSQVSENASLIVWLCVQVPQIIENHFNRSVCGLSLMLVLFWISGDITTLVGNLLKGTPFQVCISVYHCFMGLVLGIQYWFYTQIYPHTKKRHSEMHKNLNLRKSPLRTESECIERPNRFEPTRNASSTANLHSQRDRGVVNNVLKTSLSSSALIQTTNGMPIGTSSDGSNISKQTATLSKSLKNITLNAWFIVSSSLSRTLSFDKGSTVSAWICSIFYVFSRPPQIYKCYRSKSVSGLSPYTFLLAAIGNTLYSISFVSNSILLYNSNTEAYHEFMISKMPYIVSNFVMIILDIILLAQCFYYENSLQDTSESDLFNPDDNGYRYSTRIGRHKKVDNHEDALQHFRPPAWYTNIHHTSTNTDDQDDYNNTFSVESDGKIGQSQRSETTSLLKNNINTNYTLTTPPHHYIAHSSTDKSVQSSHPSILRIAANSVRAVKSIRSESSLSSVAYNAYGNNSQNNGSYLNTALLPSIVSNFSSISKKLSHDSKTPFLPSDFLSDNFYNSESVSSSTNQ